MDLVGGDPSAVEKGRGAAASVVVAAQAHGEDLAARHAQMPEARIAVAQLEITVRPVVLKRHAPAGHLHHARQRRALVREAEVDLARGELAAGNLDATHLVVVPDHGPVVEADTPAGHAQGVCRGLVARALIKIQMVERKVAARDLDPRILSVDVDVPAPFKRRAAAQIEAADTGVVASADCYAAGPLELHVAIEEHFDVRCGIIAPAHVDATGQVQRGVVGDMEDVGALGGERHVLAAPLQVGVVLYGHSRPRPGCAGVGKPDLGACHHGVVADHQFRLRVAPAADEDAVAVGVVKPRIAADVVVSERIGRPVEINGAARLYFAACHRQRVG